VVMCFHFKKKFSWQIWAQHSNYIRVTKQFEKADFIKRKVEIVAKKKDDVLVLATAKIYKNELPQKVVEEVRSRNNGIGVILSRHHLWIHRKIKRIGYDIDRSGLFRSYELLYNKHVAADITEILLKQGIS
jgi:chorismate-pyruvate lyase